MAAFVRFGEAATGFLAAVFRFAVEPDFGLTGALVRLAAGRLAVVTGTEREGLDLPTLETVVLEIFFASLALVGFGAAVFAG
ncbi:MAG TPA: hypothetical protein VFL47_04980 [Flavisolibacter sp.]|nr:hypothetical protein [Flavisolibacter sp.]